MPLSPSAKKTAVLAAAVLCLLGGTAAVVIVGSRPTSPVAQEPVAQQPVAQRPVAQQSVDQRAAEQQAAGQQSATEHKTDALPRAPADRAQAPHQAPLSEQAGVSDKPAAAGRPPQASTQTPQPEPQPRPDIAASSPITPAPQPEAQAETPRAAAPGEQASVSTQSPAAADAPAQGAAPQPGALPREILAPGTPSPASPAAPSGNEMQLASLPPLQYAPDAPIPTPRPSIGAVELPKESGKDAKSANVIFSQLALPNASSPRSIGEYNKGCISGAAPLPLVGEHWQVMRPSRNRHWGHPTLVDFIERLAGRVSQATGWRGILIGDMSQPRGGPLPFGHASHQIGLDVDIWLKPMPKEPFTGSGVEKEEAVSVLAADRKHVDPKIWDPGDAALVRLAAEEPQVERVFANAAIKQQLCSDPQSKGAAWLAKVRPWWGHDEHIHVRLKCQPGSPACKGQAAVPAGDGCGKALDSWFKPAVLAWRPPPDGTTLRKPMAMTALPAECTVVARAPATTDVAGK